MFALIFSRRFSMAHRLLVGPSGKCAVPHGHNEVVTAVLEARRPARLDGRSNMIEPFEAAKLRWHGWVDNEVDHALQLSDRDPLIEFFTKNEPEKLDRILVTPGDPTTEVLTACFMSKLNAFLDDEGGRLHCVEIRIEETPTNTVVFRGDPADYLPSHRLKSNNEPWWRRPDMCINDLEPV